MFRHALQTYIDNPNNKAVLFHDEDVVIIRDAFPKAMRHYLVIPRSDLLTHMHPLHAFEDALQYAMVEEHVNRAKDMIVESVVADGLVPDEAVARATFRNKFIRAGVHCEPSLSNLHVHVITQDFYLDRMKNKKHYNSFTTAFFVPFELLKPHGRAAGLQDPELGSATETGSDSGAHSDSDSDSAVVLRHTPRKPCPALIRDTPLTCVYCGKIYGVQFAKLKLHLAEEYGKKFIRATSPGV